MNIIEPILIYFVHFRKKNFNQNDNKEIFTYVSLHILDNKIRF